MGEENEALNWKDAYHQYITLLIIIKAYIKHKVKNIDLKKLPFSKHFNKSN